MVDDSKERNGEVDREAISKTEDGRSQVTRATAEQQQQLAVDRTFWKSARSSDVTGRPW